MYRLFYTHKKLGRYCIRIYQDTPLQAVISEISAELSKPKYHNTSCEILTDNDEIVWQYQPIRKSTKKERKMTEKQFSKYLVEVMIKSGMGFCGICVNEYCDNCGIFDSKICYKGLRAYAEKKEKENE